MEFLELMAETRKAYIYSLDTRLIMKNQLICKLTVLVGIADVWCKGTLHLVVEKYCPNLA